MIGPSSSSSFTVLEIMSFTVSDFIFDSELIYPESELIEFSLFSSIWRFYKSFVNSSAFTFCKAFSWSIRPFSINYYKSASHPTALAISDKVSSHFPSRNNLFGKSFLLSKSNYGPVFYILTRTLGISSETALTN